MGQDWRIPNAKQTLTTPSRPKITVPRYGLRLDLDSDCCPNGSGLIHGVAQHRNEIWTAGYAVDGGVPSKLLNPHLCCRVYRRW